MNQINTESADVLAPLVTRSSAAMVLTIQDKQILVLHVEGFQITTPFQFWEMMVNTNIIYHY